MKTKRIKFVRNCLLLVFLIVVSNVALGQQVGKRVGPQFPLVNSSARLIGLAEASSGITDVFSGFGSNPATLGFMKRSVTDYSAQRVAKGVTFEHLGIAYQIASEEAMAFSFDILHFGGTDFYSDEKVRDLGFEARTGLTYGLKLSEALSAGISIQALTATTNVNSTWAVSGDIGFIYAPGKYIRYALELRGLGSDYRVPTAILKTDLFSIRIPRVLAVGLVFDYPFDDRKKKLIFALQNDKVLGEESLIYRMGLEYSPQFGQTFHYVVRGGFLVRGYDVEPRLGFGIGYAQFDLDYGYRYSKRDNQPSQAFTLAFQW